MDAPRDFARAGEGVRARAEALQGNFAFEDVEVRAEERARSAEIAPVAVLDPTEDFRAFVDQADVCRPVDVALAFGGKAGEHFALENVHAGEMHLRQARLGRRASSRDATDVERGVHFDCAVRCAARIRC